MRRGLKYLDMNLAVESRAASERTPMRRGLK
jgi:hypothetical protein